MSSDIPTGRHAFNPSTDCSWLTKALIRIGGAHMPWIDNSSDAAKLASQGGSVVFTSALAFGGVIVAAWSINYQHRLYWFIFVLATLWAATVFCIDRWITASINYGELLTGPQHWAKRMWQTLWFYAARIFMAVVVGYVISESVALALFTSAIDREMETIQSQNVTAYSNTVEAEYAQKIKDAEMARDTANENRNRDATEAAKAYTAWEREYQGTGGTGVEGPSPNSANCLEPFDGRSICAESDAGQVKESTARTAATSRDAAAAAQQRVTDLKNSSQAEIDRKVADYAAVNKADTNAATRHKALVSLVSHDWGYLSWWVGITLVILVVDLTPLLLKLFSPHTPYLENARRAAATKYAETEQIRRRALGELAEVAHSTDEREHRNRMDAKTRDHEYEVAADAAQHAARHTRAALRAQAADDPGVNDLARRYLQASFAHLRSRSRRWHDAASGDRPPTTPRPPVSRVTQYRPFDDDALDTESRTPSKPPRPPAPIPAPEPDRAPRDGYGIGVGKRFPDNTLMDNNSDREWEIKSVWGDTHDGKLYIAVDAAANNGVEYVLKVYNAADRLRREQKAQGRAELHAIPPGEPINSNIARVYFSGVFQNQVVIITKKYPYTLKTWQNKLIDDNAFTLRDALDIAEQILEAVGSVWTRVEPGVPDSARVHLDIKPANVGVDHDGTPKVFDWALSRPLDEQGHTSSRISMRSPYYAPPEQDAPGDLWPTHLVAADVYAWAATLYEMITGQPPHRAEAEAHGAQLPSIVARHPDALAIYTTLRQQPPPPLSNHIAHVPATLEALLQRSLSPTPEERHFAASDGSLVARQEAAFNTLDELRQQLSYVRAEIEKATPDGKVPADLLVGGFTRYQKANPVLKPLETIDDAVQQQQQNGHVPQQQWQQDPSWSASTQHSAYLRPDDDDPDAPSLVTAH
ncbi:DUF4407 domain-containing protein [Gordonia sp. NPDC003424]